MIKRIGNNILLHEVFMVKNFKFKITIPNLRKRIFMSLFGVLHGTVNRIFQCAYRKTRTCRKKKGLIIRFAPSGSIKVAKEDFLSRGYR